MLSDIASQRINSPRMQKLLEAAFQQTRMAMVVSDPNEPDDPIVAINRAFETLTGYEEHEIIGHNCRFLQGEDTDEAEVDRIRQCLKRREVGYFELLNYRKDGTPFWNALHVGPVYDEDGELAFFFGSQWDVTEKVEAMRALEGKARLTDRQLQEKIDEVRRLQAAIDQAHDAMILTEYEPIDEPGPRIVWASHGFESMTGYAKDEVIGRSPRFLQGEGTDRERLATVRSAIEEGRAITSRTVNYKRDGTPFHLEWSIAPVHDADGEPTHWLSVQRDVTERVEAQARERMLRDELAHRHKNVFALITALLKLMPAEEGTPDEFKDAFYERLMALGSAHDLVFGEGDETASVGKIAQGVLAAFPPDQLSLSGEEEAIGGKPALNLALILHELGTNAAKHGALSRPEGRVALRWWRDETGGQDAVWFDWTEQGGPPVGSPKRKGFGSTMLEALLRSDHRPDAGIDYREAGVICRGGIERR